MEFDVSYSYSAVRSILRWCPSYIMSVLQVVCLMPLPCRVSIQERFVFSAMQSLRRNCELFLLGEPLELYCVAANGPKESCGGPQGLAW